jgi:hypothetical protein
LGAAIVLLFTTWRSWRLRVRRTRALSVLFVEELVLAFERCALYLRQREKNEVSHSDIFEFSDAQALSTLATSVKNELVVSWIVQLKYWFYQVKRHTENASKHAADFGRLGRYVEIIEDRKEQEVRHEGRVSVKTMEELRNAQIDMQKAIDNAKISQARALAFFIDANPEFVDNVTKLDRLVTHATRGQKREEMRTRLRSKLEDIAEIRPELRGRLADVRVFAKRAL